MCIQVECKEHISQLEHRLTTVEELHHRYTSYQYSYNKLVVELVRRRKYMEAATKIVQGMSKELKAMAEGECRPFFFFYWAPISRIRIEEQQLRVAFNEAHGDYLPMDVCLSIANMPTRWHVVPEESDEVEETALDIDANVLSEVSWMIALLGTLCHYWRYLVSPGTK